VTTKTEWATAQALAELRAALEAEQAARKDMRRALPDYCPEIIEMSLHEDESLVLSDFKARHPELGDSFDYELVAFNIMAPRPALCTATSRARGEARTAELAAREARNRAEQSEKFQADPAPWRSRYSAPEEELAPAEPQEQRREHETTIPTVNDEAAQPAAAGPDEDAARKMRRADRLGTSGPPSRFSWMR
jgi:hypothetical protein